MQDEVEDVAAERKKKKEKKEGKIVTTERFHWVLCVSDAGGNCFLDDVLFNSGKTSKKINNNQCESYQGLSYSVISIIKNSCTLNLPKKDSQL